VYWVYQTRPACPVDPDGVPRRELHDADAEPGTYRGRKRLRGNAPEEKNPAMRGFYSAPGEIRTPDLRFRRPLRGCSPVSASRGSACVSARWPLRPDRAGSVAFPLPRRSGSSGSPRRAGSARMATNDKPAPHTPRATLELGTPNVGLSLACSSKPRSSSSAPQQGRVTSRGVAAAARLDLGRRRSGRCPGGAAGHRRPTALGNGSQTRRRGSRRPPCRSPG
jgi:hypothetical protein